MQQLKQQAAQVGGINAVHTITSLATAPADPDMHPHCTHAGDPSEAGTVLSCVFKSFAAAGDNGKVGVVPHAAQLQSAQPY